MIMSSFHINGATSMRANEMTQVRTSNEYLKALVICCWWWNGFTTERYLSIVMSSKHRVLAHKGVATMRKSRKYL